MKINKTSLFIIGIIILLITGIIYIYSSSLLNTPIVGKNCTIIINESNNISSTIRASPHVDINVINNSSKNNLQSVNGDSIFNSINWSKYTNIERIGVHDNRITGPNSVINHTFIKFTVDVNIKDPENTKELYREMAGVVFEIRQNIGPNSSINVWGLYDGYNRYHVGMLPYDDQIYAIDHYHPQAYKNDIYLIPGPDPYDYHSYTLINNSVVEN